MCVYWTHTTRAAVTCASHAFYKSHFEVRSLLLLQNPKMSKHDRCPSPVGEPPPAKRKRPDVAARKAANKLLDISVVKSTLNSFLTEEGKHLDWDGLFTDLNKTTIEAYLFANFHVLRLCEAGLPLPHIKQDFFYNCLSLVSTSGRRKPPRKDRELQYSFDIYLLSRPNNYRPASSTNLSYGFHQCLSQQMATCSAVMISTTFYRRFLKYLRHYHRLDGREAYRMLKDIYDDDYEGNDDWILWYKESFLPPVKCASIPDQPHLAIPVLYKILQYFEIQHPIDQATVEMPKLLRLFTLLPTKNRGLVAAISRWIIVRFLAFLNEVVFRIYQQLVNGLTKSEQSTGVDFSTLPNLKQLLANLVVKL